jgi:dihydrofolate reductase
VPKVVLYQLLPLDGVAEEPGDWMVDGGPEVFDNLARVIAGQDAVLLGRGTHDHWVGFWPKSDLQPFADFINGSTKHVFTSSRPATDRAPLTAAAAGVRGGPTGRGPAARGRPGPAGG